MNQTRAFRIGWPQVLVLSQTQGSEWCGHQLLYLPETTRRWCGVWFEGRAGRRGGQRRGAGRGVDGPHWTPADVMIRARCLRARMERRNHSPD